MSALQGEVLNIVRRDRKRRERRRKFGEILIDFIVGTLGNILNALVGGWMLMLAVSVAHAEWIPQLPTIGYWWACLIVYLLRGVFSADQKKKDAS